MSQRVALSGKFDTGRVDALCGEFAHVMELTSPSPVLVDLSDLEDLSTSALAVLVATLRTARARGLCKPFDFLPPRIGSLSEVLSPASLGVLLGEVPPQPRGEGELPRFCGCMSFACREEIEATVNAMLEWLRGEMRWELETLCALEAIAWDLASNVLQHADSGGGVLALGLSSDHTLLELAVADRGIGLRASLAKNEQFKALVDDSAAVSVALAPGATSVPGRARGAGLWMGKLLFAANGGSLTARSGKARVSIPFHEQDAGGLPSFEGTLMTAVARTDRRLDLGVVIEALERIGGLGRTLVKGS
jgi:hypothetical protein